MTDFGCWDCRWRITRWSGKRRRPPRSSNWANSPMHAYLNAQANAYCGNVDLAFEWLERAYTQRNAGLSQIKLQPLLRNLHGDPRWPLFLNKMDSPIQPNESAKRATGQLQVGDRPQGKTSLRMTPGRGAASRAPAVSSSTASARGPRLRAER